MLGRVQPQKFFGDEALELHVSDRHFLMKVSGLVDWAAFDHYWPSLYGATGKRSHDPLVCFKMLLLEQWYNISDPECEAQCVDRLSFRRFLCLSLADTIPDETVLVRFRKRLLKARLAEPLFASVLAQIEATGVIVKRGTLVDATIVESARKAPPKGVTGGDSDTSWAIKNGRPVAHGYKGHIAVDDGSEIVRAIATTGGSVHDSVPMDKLLDRAPAQAVYADAAYCDMARTWAAGFVRWYNFDHRHITAAFVTSARLSAMPGMTTRFWLHDMPCTSGLANSTRHDGPATRVTGRPSAP